MFDMKYTGILLAISNVALAQHGGKPKSAADIAEERAAELLNHKLPRNYFLALAAFACMFIFYRLMIVAVQNFRTIACLSNDTQRYFAIASPQWAKFKSMMLYAPLFRARHNREFRLSSAINMGTLPSRFQSIFIGVIVATNVVLCVYGIRWTTPRAKVLSVLRNRTGTISVANMIPLVLMAGRNNPLIPLLNVSFDSFNMMHRWLGRLAILEAIAHTLCWMISKVDTAGWSAVKASIINSHLITTGLISIVGLVVILVQSPSAIRHAFYETFLHLHIALVVLSFVGLWMHLAELPQRSLLVATIAAWMFDRSLRFWNIFYRNVGRGGTKATIEALPGDALRVSLDVVRPWKVRPGQHVYITIPSVGMWTSHPFSIAWNESGTPFSRGLNLNEKSDSIIMTQQDLQSTKSKTISVIIRRRTGFTDTLYTRAEKAGAFDGASKLTLKALVEGPYGSSRPMSSYGTVLLFAAGVGITHQVPYVRDLVAGYTAGTVATRRITLVWIVQSPDHLEWIRPWMTQILAMEKRREILGIKLFITRPRNKTEVVSPSSTVQMFPGRPCVETLVGKECESQIGAMGVSVCGTGSLSDDVRRVVRSRQGWCCVDFVEESFTW
ncbi:hypothetical protein GJ744_008560 [Endocarpon pusillum]|uniref:ferric-chelate reductase (NADPH) n=1 Tax=Endocarpon pusillum TaxID=364733 RepID=A0A8H7AKU4_9EURO|nr:hypothetical protein GJ744_008560 [Endocarpon pusillum]